MDFQTSQNNKFFSYVIILLAFFILIFVTRGFFYTLQEKKDELSEISQKFADVKQEHKELEELKIKFESNQDELLKNISKYTLDFTSENIFNYIHTYVESINSGGQGNIVIRSINIDEGTIGDIGMHQGSVDISAAFSSQKVLLEFLDYFVNPESQYTFFISSFSYPEFGKTGPIQVSIPLKIFYKK